VTLLPFVDARCIEANVHYLHARVSWCLLGLDEDNTMASTFRARRIISLQCGIQDNGVGDFLKLCPATKTMPKLGHFLQKMRGELAWRQMELTRHCAPLRDDTQSDCQLLDCIRICISWAWRGGEVFLSLSRCEETRDKRWEATLNASLFERVD
jgi:hypothetical protein